MWVPAEERRQEEREAGSVPAPPGPAGAAEGDGGPRPGPPPGQRAAVPAAHPLHAARPGPMRAADHRHPRGPGRRGSAQAPLQVPDSGGEAAGRPEQESGTGTPRGGEHGAGGRSRGRPEGAPVPNRRGEGPGPVVQEDVRDRRMNHSNGKER